MKTSILIRGFLGVVILFVIWLASMVAMFIPLYKDGVGWSFAVGTCGLIIYFLLQKELRHWWQVQKGG